MNCSFNVRSYINVQLNTLIFENFLWDRNDQFKRSILLVICKGTRFFDTCNPSELFFITYSLSYQQDRLSFTKQAIPSTNLPFRRSKNARFRRSFKLVVSILEKHLLIIQTLLSYTNVHAYIVYLYQSNTLTFCILNSRRIDFFRLTR